MLTTTCVTCAIRDSVAAQAGECANTPRLLTTEPEQEVTMAGRLSTSTTTKNQRTLPPELDDGFALVCPYCGSANSQHSGLKAWYRASEDARRGLYAAFGFGEIQTSEILPVGNPSLRRDGFAVLLTCEDCEGAFSLTIAQHKGQTVLGIETR